MASFGSPLKRVAALATLGVAALVGTQTAKAQNSFDPATAALVYNTNRQNAEAANSTKGSNVGLTAEQKAILDAWTAAQKTAPKPIVVDTDENRQSANRIYAVAYAGFLKDMKNNNTSFDINKSLEKNSELVKSFLGARDGKTLTYAIISADAYQNALSSLKDNKNRSSLSNEDWNDALTYAASKLSNRQSGETERNLLVRLLQDHKTFTNVAPIFVSFAINNTRSVPNATSLRASN
jgi:hypothetical protein